MKNIAIWLDSEKAHIITMLNEKETMQTIGSGVEHFHPHGGFGSSTPYNSQDATSEKKLLERKKHQLKNYFKEIINNMDDDSAIAIFGPGFTKTEFEKELGNHNENNYKIIAVESADSMTENQLKAFAKKLFNSGF